MRFYWSSLDHSGLRFAPAVLGIMLIAIGLLIFFFPRLVDLVIASVFVLVGVSLLLSAWKLRRPSTYSPIEPEWRVRDPNEE